jgi:hypothetical protein
VTSLTITPKYFVIPFSSLPNIKILIWKLSSSEGQSQHKNVFSHFILERNGNGLRYLSIVMGWMARV